MTPVAWDGMRGWLYMPAEGVPQREACVFFGAHGVEDLCARHSLACLANQLAQQGHPVLRFDLPGTGDALGSFEQPDLWAQWLTAGVSAVKALKAWSGAQHVGALGLRLGALVAGHVALALADTPDRLASLALLAPVLQGKQHVRELKAMGLPGPDDSLEVSELRWSAALLASLRQADLTTAPATPPVNRLFLGLAQGGKGVDAFVGGWTTGVDVVTAPYGDLAAHIGNTVHSQPPTALWQALCHWLGHGPHAATASQVPTTQSEVLTDTAFVELGCLVPAVVPLAGVWTEPVGSNVHSPVVVLCNTGRNPHTGWAGGTVAMARQLAREGLASLRFDFAGVGDSLPMPEPPAEILYNDVALPQLAAVFSHVQARVGAQRPVVVVGLCSGGYAAFRQAVMDARVSGLLLANVQRYVWQEGMSLEAAIRVNSKSMQAYRRLLFRPDTWARVARGQVNVSVVAGKFVRGWQSRGRRWLQAAWNGIKAGIQPAGPTAARRPDTIPGCFAVMARRGTQVTVLYSEDDGGRDEFASYFGTEAKRFLAQPGTRLQIIPGADHVLGTIKSRSHLLTEIRRLCEKLDLQPPGLAASAK
jgi:alpha-beta hydrolase superfamily lysophospholipase